MKWIQIILLSLLYLNNHSIAYSQYELTINRISGQTSIPYWTLEHGNRRVNSVWVNQAGTLGWAVGENGEILQLKNGEWMRYKHSGIISKANLEFIWVNEFGTEGWITGNWNVLLYLKDQEWHMHKQSGILSEGFVSISINQNGKEGWAITKYGRILYLKDDEWVMKQAANFFLMDLKCLWVNQAGTEGWIGGSKGEILHLKEGRWEEYKGNKFAIKAGIGFICANQTGSEGYAACANGDILHLIEGEWKKDKSLCLDSNESIFSIWLNQTGTEGWALNSEKYVFHLKDGKWKKYEQIESSKINSNPSIWMNQSLTEGWLINREDQILHLKDGIWKNNKTFGSISSANLSSVSMNNAGTEGWAVGSAEILHLKDGKWERYEQSDLLTNCYLESIWLNQSGSEGWAVGNGGEILHLKDGKWERSKQSGIITQKILRSVYMYQSGTGGWAVGYGGEILHFKDGIWERSDQSGIITEKWLNSIWLNQSGSEGWAVGNEGEILHLKDRKWERSKQAGIITENRLLCIWMNQQGTEGWAVGDDGTILQMKKGKWEKHRQSGIFYSYILNFIWSNKNGSEGLAAGYGESTLYLKDGIFENVKHPHKSLMALRSFCVNQSESEGWAVGEYGEILHLKIVKNILPAVEINDKSSINKLNGIYQIIFKYPIDTINAELLSVGDNPINYLSPSSYEIESKSDSVHLFTIKNPNTLLSEVRNKKCFLRFKISYSFNTIPLTTAYDLEPVYYEGRSKQFYAVLLSLGIIFLYLVLVLLAIPFASVRNIILHPVGSSLIGLYFGKVLWIDFLIRFIKPIRLGIFRDYRKCLNQAPFVAKWDEQFYIAPQIEFQNKSTKELSTDEIINDILKESRNKLWLVIGPSGLGKTALLENWTKISLKLNKTPVFISLGSDLSPEAEAASSFGQYGDVNVTPEVAFDLLKHGGFVILLDGFNEDLMPQATREFVRQVSKKNWVVMAGQFDPGWEQMIKIRYIDLKPFGRKQLEAIMDVKWVDQLLQSDLEPLAKLPHTAKLIGEYISQNNQLPTFHLDIYRNLRRGFDEDIQSINLENRAWEMFKTNGKLFIPDEQIPDVLCDIAVHNGILTRQKEKYNFRHERIFRFFVACYLHRRDYRPMDKWHSELNSGLGRNYWTDVLELWAEMYAEEVVIDQTKHDRLINFLKEVGKFNPFVFKERLYPLYIRLYESSKLIEDTEFIKWSAKLLSNDKLI